MAYEFASRLETFPHYRKFETTFAGRPFVEPAERFTVYSRFILNFLIIFREDMVSCTWIEDPNVFPLLTAAFSSKGAALSGLGSRTSKAPRHLARTRRAGT